MNNYTHEYKNKYEYKNECECEYEYDKINYFHNLLNNFITHINELIDCMNAYKLLTKYSQYLPIMKLYVENNKTDILQKCIQNIGEFVNFSLDEFNDLDDNQSYNMYMPKIKKNKIDKCSSNEIFNFLLEIKCKSCDFDKKTKKIMKQKINNIVDTLVKINDIFS